MEYIKKNYWKEYQKQYNIKMSEKLGLIDSDMESSQLSDYYTDEVKTLIDELWVLMYRCGSDFTNTFRSMSLVTKEAEMQVEDLSALQALSIENSAPKEALFAQVKSEFENPRILELLEVQP